MTNTLFRWEQNGSGGEDRTMKKHIWHSGPPPSIGWWPASYDQNPEAIRWWNGKCWSMLALPSESARIAASKAAIELPYTKLISWCARWWE